MTRWLPRAAWVVRRAVLALVTIVAVSTLTFVLIHLSPGDPIYLLAGDGGSPSYYAEMRAKYGLDRPLLDQFLLYARGICAGDMGYSFMYQAPVAQVIGAHAPATLLLGGTALVAATVWGFSLGLLAASRAGRTIDAVIRVLASVAFSAPVFWTGQMLIIAFAVTLDWLPVAGISSARADAAGASYAADVATHLILPAVALALPFTAMVARVTRAAALAALAEPFVLAVAARGFSRSRTVVRHAGAHAAVSVVAIVGEHAGNLLAGAAFTEALFGWPGTGWLMLHASLHRDYPLVIGSFLVISAWVAIATMLTDLASAALDPRIRRR